MSVQLKSTKGGGSDGVKILCFGESGAGKTLAIRGLPNPMILSTEKGLLSLADFDLPYEAIDSIEKLDEVYDFIVNDPVGKQFESIALDSITDIAEVCLNAEKKKSADGRAAYGNMNDVIAERIRKFRDLPGRNIYMTAQLDKVQDERGKVLYGPSMPGKTLTQSLAFFFDIVLALRVESVVDETTPGGFKVMRMFQTQTDGLWQAKNRGGRLEMWEEPDLGAVIRKVRGTESATGTAKAAAK
jgi:hypothetical protein